MPDLDDLDDFSEGLHVNPLPASEVRRRGDRMRRRNTALATVGGVVAAAVFIGAPVALLSGNDDSGVEPAPAPPSPTATEDSPGGITWLQEIPAEFPLTDGFPAANGLDGSPTEAVKGPDLTPLDLCGTSWPAVTPDDAAGIDYQGESEDTSSRILLLLGDDLSAAAALNALEAAVQGCPDQPTAGGDSIMKSSLVDLDLGTEHSVVVAQRVQLDDGLLTDLTMTEVAQTGNALFIETSYGSAAEDDVIEFEADRLLQRSAVPLGAMCLFAAEPCTLSTGQGEAPADGAPSSDSGTNPAIPAEFPLDRGLDDGGATDVAVAPPIDLCGTPAWQPVGVVEERGVRSSGIEVSEDRLLATFGSAVAATEAVDAVRQAVSACAETTGETYPGFPTSVLEGDTGYDSFTWGAVDGSGAPFGWTFQLTRVGTAVLVQYAEGEMSEASLQPSADAQTEVSVDLAPEMCLWTDAGCQ